MTFSNIEQGLQYQIVLRVWSKTAKEYQDGAHQHYISEWNSKLLDEQAVK
ncbi:unnamed protein product [Paramecium octaurelia]|uniref:Uncharacterized protein n=1 Tax=Paramecium octaurelia TaxID=43137 RepID=A0A8S1YNU4_PAROT|nr:unnamed protein product [Paramecium octaurelia]